MSAGYVCPAKLNIAGEGYPCDMPIAEGSDNHEGWAHSNREAEAIWCGNEAAS